MKVKKEWPDATRGGVDPWGEWMVPNFGISNIGFTLLPAPNPGTLF